MKDWQKILIQKQHTILHALEVLNLAGTKFVAIVDENRKILGSLTDGDIRRGLLRGIQVHATVEEVMNRSPKTLPVNTPKSEISKIMKENDIFHLPLVDSENIIADIMSVHEIEQVDRRENHVVLMAGGLGSRLAGLTVDCPKPMLKVGGKPILETIIEVFKKQGFYKFIISVNYKSEMIESFFKDGRDFDVEISYIKEHTRLGTAGALSLYESNGLPFIVINGDVLTKVNFTDLMDFHIQNKNSATMCLRQYEHQIPFGVVVTDQDRVVKIEEKPLRRYFVNGGIYVLSPDVLKHVPQQTYCDMPSILEKLIEKESRVGAYPFHEYWIDVGSLDDYERAFSEFLEVFK